MSQTDLDSEAIETVLCQIADIEAARVVFNGSSVVDELHILALPNKGPKQILRDVESALMARFGLDIDHKKISIAQLGSNGNGSKQSVIRPKVLTVNTEVANMDVKVTVELQIGERRFCGSSSGTASKAGRLRMAAEATLAAIEECHNTDQKFSLEDATIVRLGSEMVAVTCITIISSGKEDRICGSVIVTDSEIDTIVRATLAAINRRVGI